MNENSKMMGEGCILILANEEGIDENIGFILKQLGYTYLVANRDYLRAMELLSTNQIKCILLPLLDEEDGLLVQAIYQAYQIPCVFYIPYFTDQVLQQIKEVSPPVYLTKIYNKEEVYVNIELACYKNQYKMRCKLLKSSSFYFNKECLSFKKNDSFYKMTYHEIIYIKSEDASSRIYTSKEKNHLIESSLSTLLEELPLYFCQIHQNYIINLKNVDIIHSKSVLVGEHEIPLGKNYQNELMQLIALSRDSCFL